MVPDPEFMWLWIRRTRSVWPGQVWREREEQAYKQIYEEEEHFPFPLNESIASIIRDDFIRQNEWMKNPTGDRPEWETDFGRAYAKAAEQCGAHSLQSSASTQAWIWRQIIETIRAEMSSFQTELDAAMELHRRDHSNSPIGNGHPSQLPLWDSASGVTQE